MFNPSSAWGFRSHTVDKASVVVLDSLGQVHVTGEVLAILVSEFGAEDWDRGTTLDGEVGTLGGLGECFDTVSHLPRHEEFKGSL